MTFQYITDSSGSRMDAVGMREPPPEDSSFDYVSKMNNGRRSVSNSSMMETNEKQKMKANVPTPSPHGVDFNLMYYNANMTDIPNSLPDDSQQVQRIPCAPKAISKDDACSLGLLDPVLSSQLEERRQKRLERNRESARVSRLRRKQYLEGLGGKVGRLSEEVDRGRRQLTSESVSQINRLRGDILTMAKKEMAGDSSRLWKLTEILATSASRTSDELRIAATFQKEQLKSFIVPQYFRFILWLTLQNESHFRGGRALSERLSASRIGERMLQNGNNAARPSNMWPLLCNEVSLSFDQEERLRTFQRSILTNQQSWVDRHTVFASGIMLDALHECMNGVSEMIRRRESSMLATLSPTQKLRFLIWAKSNKMKMMKIMEQQRRRHQFKLILLNTSKSNHVSANLYNICHQLKSVSISLPMCNSPVIPKHYLKSFGCRPCFESLAVSMKKSSSSSSLKSSSSNGSSKRSSGSISAPECYDDVIYRVTAKQHISPHSAQIAAFPFVVKLLIPASSFPVVAKLLESAHVMHKGCSSISQIKSNASHVSPSPTVWTSDQQNVISFQHHQNSSATTATSQIPAVNPHFHQESHSTFHPIVAQNQQWASTPFSPFQPKISYQPQYSLVPNFTLDNGTRTSSPISSFNQHPASQREQFVAMKAVPEETEEQADLDYLLAFAEDWTIEGVEIETSNPS